MFLIYNTTNAQPNLTIQLTHIIELRIRIEDELDTGWQESSKRDVFIKDIKQTLQELILRDYKDKFTVKDFPKFLNRLVDIILKKF